MNRKEINEIKSQFKIEDCGIQKMYGCFVNGEKEIVSTFGGIFTNLPEEEQHKYFEIFKKTLSGTPGKNLVDMQFNVDSYSEDGARTFLYKLRDCELENEELLNDFYNRIIASYSYPGNYLILIMNQNYDVPKITNDNIKMEDASEEVYRYILCSICHVTLSKSGLGYDEEDGAFHNSKQNQMVDVPDIGFLFPSFKDRSEDGDYTLFYSKDTADFQQDFINDILDCQIPLPAVSQKETFNALVEETLGDDCSYETIKNIHESISDKISKQKAVDSNPVMLDKVEVKEILENSGVSEEKLEHFEERFEEIAGQDSKLIATNIVPATKFEVKTPDVIIKIKPNKTDLVETRVIDGAQCLVIKIDERLEVNGISVNPNTGEVIDRN